MVETLCTARRVSGAKEGDMQEQDPYSAAREMAGQFGGRAVYLAAGLADTALERVESTARALRGLSGRSDLGGLFGDGLDSLAARGEIAVKRVARTSPPHMEYLAQRAAARMRADAADA
jgi:hypothetical protein